MSHRDFYKRYIIALSSGQKKLELGLTVIVIGILLNIQSGAFFYAPLFTVLKN